MRLGEIAFISFFLFIAVSAFAAPPEYYEADDWSRGGRIKIEILSKADCQAILGAALRPEAMVKESLAVFQAINQSDPGVEANLECLQGFVAAMPSELGGAGEIRLPFRSETDSLHTVFYGGRFFEDKASVNHPDVEKLLEAYLRLVCINPFKEGSSQFRDYRQNHSEACQRGWGAQASREEAKAKYAAAFQAFQKSEAEQGAAWEGHRSRFRFLGRSLVALDDPKGEYSVQQKMEKLSSISDGRFHYDVEKAEALIKRLNCFDPQKAGVAATEANKQYYFMSYRSYDCEGVVTVDQVKEDFAKLKALLPLQEEQMAKIQKEHDERVGRITQMMEAAYAPEVKSYGLRRLFARFGGYRATKPEKIELEKFCSSYEKEQRRDKKFSESGFKLVAFTSNVDWKWAEKYGVTEGELSAIRLYSGSMYGQINPELWRKKKLDEKMALYKEVMDSGMDRLPPYRATALKRFASLPKELLDQHQVGEVLTYDAYTSTSRKPGWTWGGGVGQSFLIYGAEKGKDISEVSLFPGEEEVLFRAGTRFKVIGRETEDGKLKFVLGEADESGTVLAAPPM